MQIMSVINALSVYAIPLMIGGIVCMGMWRKVSVYECFISGAEDGLQTVIRIFPILLAILVAVGMLRASGTMELILNLIKPVTNWLKIPESVVPLALLRPISGGGSLGIVTDILNTDGADSLAGRTASVLMGSTETTFYTLAVYFRATRVKNTRVALPSALVGDFVGVVVSIWICRFLFLN